MVVFVGLLMLGHLTGLLWHIRTFAWWIPLKPVVLGPTEDWVVWGASFLVSISPNIVAVARRRVRSDFAMVMTSFIFPVLSLVSISWSYFVGGTLLVGSGFLVTYALVSRSTTLLGVSSRSAARMVCTEVFAFLSMVAAGGVVSLLLWRGGAISSLRLGQPDLWSTMLAIDLEVFLLVRPILAAVLLTVAVSAIIALFLMEPLRSIARRISAGAVKDKRPNEKLGQLDLTQQSRRVTIRKLLPYLILLASVGLGISITLYPYTVANVRGVLGSDMWFYSKKLGEMTRVSDAFLETDRSFVLLVLFVTRAATGLSTLWVLRLMPAFSSALLAVSSFVLVKEGTGRPWVAALAALMSVVSAQTSLGMGAGIIASWFAMSIANFALALVARSIRLRSELAAVGSALVLVVLLASYAYLWIIILAALVLVLLALIVSLPILDRRQAKYEVPLLGSVLVGAVLIPLAFLYIASGPLGFRVPGINPVLWFNQGWSHLTRVMTPDVFGSTLPALEEALDFAGNRVDLPFLTLLSIVGLLDTSSRTPSFGRIMAAMILVPIAVSLVTTDLLSTWRGLYVIPMYLAGALGAESIILRVNGEGSTWKRLGPLAFAGAFTGYIFLSHLSYSLRALYLLIMVSR